MRRKFADLRDVEDIIDADIKTIRIQSDMFDGYISALRILKVKKPWYVDVEKRCTLNDGYLWLEIYQSNKNYVVSAIYDDKDNIKEWYIDIAKEVGIIDNVPYEDDLYLDVVVVPDGRVKLLDEDELKDAFDNGDITKEEYDLAYDVANNIMNGLAKEIDYLMLLSSALKEKVLEVKKK